MKRLLIYFAFSLGLTGLTGVSHAQSVIIFGPQASETLDLKAFASRFDPIEIKTVSTWSNGKEILYRGYSLDALLDSYAITADRIIVEAENGYASEIPREMIARYKPILAVEGDGVPLDFATRGPIALIWPRSQFPKALGETTDGMWTWYVNGIRPLN